MNMERPRQEKPGLMTRIYRKHIVAPVKELEYGLRGFEDLLASVDEIESHSVLNATVLPALDRGLLALRAAWERSRFKHLQSDKGRRTVERQRGVVEHKSRAVDDEAMRAKLVEETYSYEMEGMVSALNESMGRSSDLESLRFRPEHFATPELFLVRAKDVRAEVELELKNHAALVHDEWTASNHRGQYASYSDYLQEVLMKLGAAEEFAREYAARSRKSFKAIASTGAALSRAEHSKNLPETRLTEHERLEAQRELFSSLVHKVELKRTVMQRKMDELALDIDELKQFRDPALARYGRERQGLRMVRAELDHLAKQAYRFSNADSLKRELEGDEAEGIPKKRTVEEFGRRPRVIDVERLLHSASIPDKARERLLSILYGQFDTPKKRDVGNVDLTLRYSFVKGSTFEVMLDTLKGSPVRISESVEKAANDGVEPQREAA